MFGKKPRYFGNNIPPACEYCAHWRNRVNQNTFLCPKSGMVQAHYKCRKFQYNPLRRVPRRQPKLPDFSPEDFRLS